MQCSGASKFWNNRSNNQQPTNLNNHQKREIERPTMQDGRELMVASQQSSSCVFIKSPLTSSISRCFQLERKVRLRNLAPVLHARHKSIGSGVERVTTRRASRLHHLHARRATVQGPTCRPLRGAGLPWPAWPTLRRPCIDESGQSRHRARLRVSPRQPTWRRARALRLSGSGRLLSPHSGDIMTCV